MLTFVVISVYRNEINTGDQNIIHQEKGMSPLEKYIRVRELLPGTIESSLRNKL